MTTLAEVLGRAPGFDAVVEALAAGLAEALGVPLVPGGLSPDESALTDALVASKYGTDGLDRRRGGCRTASRPPGRRRAPAA